MSIQALVGLTGHGKSYSAIDMFLLPAVKEGRIIVTNVPILPKLYEDYPQALGKIHDIDLSEMAKPQNNELWLDQPKGALFLLDELWRVWPSGLKTKDIPHQQISFIKEHRHNIDESGREPDIVLITQSLADIASSIRDMAELTIICTKLIELGAKNNFRRDVYRGAIKGFTGPKTAFTTSEQCRYDPKVYQYYKSHTKAEGNATSINNKGVVNKTIFSSFTFKAGCVVLVLVIAGAVYGYNLTSDDLEKMMKPKETSAPIPQNVPAQNAQVMPVKTGPVESPSMRITGVISDGQRSIYLIEDAATGDHIKLNRLQCKYDYDLVDHVCHFQGMIITRNTGMRSKPEPSFSIASISPVK